LPYLYLPDLNQSLERYALVDIETTGGYAANNGITEVAIVLHDGYKAVQRLETLVNPGMPIPAYIQTLTGITDEMVSGAPGFESIAGRIHEMLDQSVFVAHNVNFDYSFLKHHLELAGYILQSKKLCTLRLSRKVFPNLPSYSLGKLCRQLGIPITGRHRAGGDLDATVRLFERILLQDAHGHVQSMLRSRSREQYLPPNLPAEQLKGLPEAAGVYYFLDQKAKVVYVGKAKNLRRRVLSHFSNNRPGQQKQEFLRTIHSLYWQLCGSELMAYLLECVEIRRLWPKYNQSLKRFEPHFGLYAFEDQRGFLRMGIEKTKRQLPSLYSFGLMVEGQNLLRRLLKQWKLCPILCYLQTQEGDCQGIKDGYCQGACCGRESVETYNSRVREAIASLGLSLPSFGLIDRGRHPEEQSCIWVEKGRLYGMGFLPTEARFQDAEELKSFLTPYPENDYMRSLVYQHAARWPQKKLLLPAAAGE
jgi:DNA polymerase-3 subunit epsilon